MPDYYEILGVKRDASVVEIRKAYAQHARERHPDLYADPAAKKEAEALFTELTTAFNALSSDKNRREYDATLSRPKVAVPEQVAQDAYDRGLQRLEQRAFHEAGQLLRTAVERKPEEPRYHAALGLALAKNPNWVREGIQQMEQAIQLQPTRAVFHAQLAELMLGQGLTLRARRSAEAALRLDPNNATALRVMDETAPDSGDEPPGAGGLRGLLRRRSWGYDARAAGVPSPRVPAHRGARAGPCMKVPYQALTDVGRKRKGNEDSLYVNPEQKLFVVADGMGGHAAG